MKQLTCEMCGSTDLVKRDGVFICQTCGCKYSVEEAKKIMIEGNVDVSGSTVKIDNSALVENYLQLSQNALDVANKESALLYANKALEIQPTNYTAWFAKMQSIDVLGDAPQISLELNEAGQHTIEYAPDRERQTISNKVYTYQLNQASFLIRQSCIGLEDVEKVRSLYNNFARISTAVALQKVSEVDIPTIALYKRFTSNAITLVLLISDESIASGSDLISILERIRNQYQYYIHALRARYRLHSTFFSLDERKAHQKFSDDISYKISHAKQIQASLKATNYWEIHPLEHTALLNQKTSIEESINTVSYKLQDLNDKTDITDLRTQIKNLKEQKQTLGFFNTKEKKNIQADIDSCTCKLNELLEANRSSHDALESKMSELTAQLQKVISKLESPV